MQDITEAANPEENNTINQIFDKLMKRILSLSKGAVIGLMNGIFNDDFPPNSEITFNATENVNSKLQRTVADIIITLRHDDKCRRFHMEVQINNDNTIVLRVFEYGFYDAIKHQLILRISDVSEHDRKKAAYERMKYMDEHNVPMSRPVDFGICDDGQSVYQLLTWCDGESLDDTLHRLSETEQYHVGIKAGRILRKIHSVPVVRADITSTSWNERYSEFIDESVSDFCKTGVNADNAEILLDYFNTNRHLLNERPQCYLHGDFHAGNLMITPEHELSIIDWEIHLFNSYGDPWHEVGVKETLYFCTGFIRGYFNGEPPQEYWRILAVYESIGAISCITWAYYHHPEFYMRKSELSLMCWLTSTICRPIYRCGIK